MKIRAKSCLVLKCPSKFLLTCSTHAVDFVTQHKDGDDHQIQLVLSALKSCKKCQGVTLCLIITVSFLLRRILRIGSWEICPTSSCFLMLSCLSVLRGQLGALPSLVPDRQSRFDGYLQIIVWRKGSGSSKKRKNRNGLV